MQNETATEAYLVAQLGARMHYAVPRMLQKAGILEHFYTDICAIKGWPRALSLIPSSLQSPGLKRLRGRVPADIPSEKITSFSQFGLAYQRRLASSSTPMNLTDTYLWAGRRFCELVINAGIRNAAGIYVFNTAGLELLTAARARGLRSIVEQTIAPRGVETQILQEEHDRYPGWEPAPSVDSSQGDYIARERAEWSHADAILCGSEFVREAIVASGGPAEKCRVVPYGVDAHYYVGQRQTHVGPLRVLTVGGVGLRKGSPYILEVARTLAGLAEFRLVGGLLIGGHARKLLESAVVITGAVPRSEMRQHFAWADVFLLPSLCEGSATVVYEALAAGLPVICTPNTGSVVRDGIDGFIVPIRNPDAIAEGLTKLATDSALRREMSSNARVRASDYTLDRYQERLRAVLPSASTISL